MNHDWSFWLMMTNLALALVVLLAVLIVLVAVAWGFMAERRKAAKVSSIDEELSEMLRAESHRFAVPELGLTMADGGEELQPQEKEPAD